MRLTVTRIRNRLLAAAVVVVALWVSTAVFGPVLILRFATLSPTALDRLQEVYNEEDRISALVREGVLKAPPSREVDVPRVVVHRLGCPAPLVFDGQLVYSADGKSRSLMNARFLLTPWRIYLLRESR